jgi:hypothetical protein
VLVLTDLLAIVVVVLPHLLQYHINRGTGDRGTRTANAGIHIYKMSFISNLIIMSDLAIAIRLGTKFPNFVKCGVAGASRDALENECGLCCLSSIRDDLRVLI